MGQIALQQQLRTNSLFLGGKSTSELDIAILNHLGIGVFETFAIKQQSRGEVHVRELGRHYSRLVSGAEKLSLLTCPAFKEIVTTVLEACSLAFTGPEVFRGRVVVTKENWFFNLQSLENSELLSAPIRLKSVNFERNIPEIKSCSAIVSYLANSEAKRAGADEALLVDNMGIAREAAWANFFWIDRQGRIFTPASNILPGITRSLVIESARELANVEESDMPLSRIMNEADMAFITQSIRGVVPVSAIDARVLKGCDESPIVKAIVEKLDGISQKLT